MTEFEKMTQGLAFNGCDETIDSIRSKAFQLLQRYNTLPVDQSIDIASELFGSIGDDSMVMPPFHCEFGKTVHIGPSTFINMGAMMLDGAPITIGSNVLIGPNCQFYTAGHSMDYRSRRKWETFCKPIVVGDDVWVGGNTVICQGVTIGARSVIAANSVVTKDMPEDCLIGGTPARVIRKLHENETPEEALEA